MASIVFTSIWLSDIEKDLIRKAFEGTEFVFSQELTSACMHVLGYRVKISDKYLQAKKWGAPLISVS